MAELFVLSVKFLSAKFLDWWNTYPIFLWNRKSVVVVVVKFASINQSSEFLFEGYIPKAGECKNNDNDNDLTA